MWCIFVVLYFVSGALAYPSGAPDSACNFMTPSHGYPPQFTPPPYKIEVSADCYTPGETLQVTLSATTKDGIFVGFLMVGRIGPDFDPTYVGQFMPIQDTTQAKCKSGRIKHGVTHTYEGHEMFEDDNTNTITHDWVAPDPGVGQLCINATVVKEKSTFWVGVSTCFSECAAPTKPTTAKPTDKPPAKRCTDSLSKKNPVTVPIPKKNGEPKDVKINNCKKMKKLAFSGLCSRDALGGFRHVCCSFCKGKCVESITWKSMNKKCKDCTCRDIKKKGLMDNCCSKNWRGLGFDGKMYRCKNMCCASCSKL